MGWTGTEGRYLALADVPTWLNLFEQGDMIYIVKPLSQFRQHSGQDQNNFGTNFLVMINWALEIQYAWRRKVFLETEWDIRTAIINWTKTTTKNLSVYQEKMPELSPIEKKNLHALEQLLAIMTAALSNGYLLDFGGVLEADEAQK